jgi:hypothetical protein
MKKIIIIFTLILFSCKSGDTNSEEKTPTVVTKPTAVAVENAKKVSERFELVAPDSVDVVKKTNSYNLGKRLLTVCNSFKFKKFTTKEATESVIKNTNLAKMTIICQKINQRNGKFIDLKLIDVIRDTQSEDQVFRYNINYQKKNFKRELKVTINSEGKISAISTREITKIIK